MIINTYDKKIIQNPTQFFTSNSLDIDISIHLLDVMIKVGKHFPIILLSLASLNILLAANDFLANSLVFAIFNVISALGNFICVIQIHQRRKITTGEYCSTLNRDDNALVSWNELR